MKKELKVAAEAVLASLADLKAMVEIEDKRLRDLYVDTVWIHRKTGDEREIKYVSSVHPLRTSLWDRNLFLNQDDIWVEFKGGEKLTVNGYWLSSDIKLSNLTKSYKRKI